MRKNVLILAAICIASFMVGGCAGSAPENASLQNESISIHMNTENEGADQESASDLEQESKGTLSNAGDTAQAGAAGNNTEEDVADPELEEQLARYRQEREDMIQEANGLVEGGSPDEAHYTFDLSGTSYSGQFDTRETTEAYAAARIYVTDTLGITPGTKQIVYMCVDPRVLKIYEDEDKGVADGYDNSNIFVCEYCSEEDVWQYLILVRDGKGSQWNVIHSGSGYKE